MINARNLESFLHERRSFNRVVSHENRLYDVSLEFLTNKISLTVSLHKHATYVPSEVATVPYGQVNNLKDFLEKSFKQAVVKLVHQIAK